MRGTEAPAPPALCHTDCLLTGGEIARRLAIVAAATAACTTIFLVASALAAYSSPRLEVSQSGGRVTLDIAQHPDDDATAIVRLISPIGTDVPQSPTAGTTIGTATASFVSTAAANAQVSTQGTLQVVGPASGTPSGCAAGERVLAHWSLGLAGEGLAVTVPVFLLVGGDLLLCLPHPGTLEGGAKLVGLQLTLDGALELPSAGTWISILVPYGGTTPDTSRIVASPAVVGAGSVTFTARARGAGAVLVGFVRHAGAPRADARVRITGGPRRSSLRQLGIARTNRQGQFTFRAKAGTFFRARAVVPRSSPPGLCFVLEPFLRPIPCINPTLNGFSVQSRVLRKR
jgi:hypothetical protein